MINQRFKALLAQFGLIRIPKYTTTYCGSTGFETFSLVTFEDGIRGHIINKTDGSFAPYTKLVPRDSKKTFVSIKDASRALYRGIYVYGISSSENEKLGEI